MRYIIHLLFYCFALLNTVAGQFIFTSKKPIETYQTAIDKNETIQLKNAIPFSFIRIIDSRYDTTNIGLYLDGYLALKDISQPTALQHTIDKYYHSLYTTSKDTLLIQLEKLNIQDEIIRDTSFVFTAGGIECKLYSGGNNQYIFTGVCDTAMKENYDYHTTFSAHKNGKHYNFEFWDYYLLRLCEAAIQKAIITKDSTLKNTIDYCSVEQIKQDGLLKRNKPILTDTALKPGFYHNFDEFVNNLPTFEYNDAASLQKLLAVMHYRTGKNISNEAPDTTYWGYCDGKNLFVRFAYNFYQLEKKDNSFYIAASLDAKRREVKASGWNMLIGIAALSAGIASKEGVIFDGFSAIHPPAIPMVILPNGNHYMLGLRLDWDTGNITY